MKKFFSAILLMAVMAFSVSTFVSCNDLTDEMEAVTEQAGANADAIEVLKGQVATLEQDLQDANNAITAAKNEAQAAVAKAKAEAIEEALNQAKALIDQLEKDHAADKAELEKAINDLTQKVDGINGIVNTNQSAIEAIKIQIKALETFQATATEDIADNKEAIEKVASDLANLKTELEEKIKANADAITELEKKHADELKAINAAITAINADLLAFTNRLTSIYFVPDYYMNSIPAIMFESIYYNELAPKTVEKYLLDEKTGKEYYSTALAEAKYRLNPRNVGPNCADFTFVGDVAETLTKVAPNAPINTVGTPVYEQATGYMKFTVKKTAEFTNYTEENEIDIVALKATLKEGLTAEELKNNAVVDVYSEYSTVDQFIYRELYLADKLEVAPEHHYVETFAAATELASGDVGYYRMDYDKVFDLKKYVTTCLMQATNHTNLDLEKYGFTYRFAKVPHYIIHNIDTETDQQTVIAAVNGDDSAFQYNTDGLFKTVTGKESIGRTPILMAELMHGDKIVKRAYVKVLIGVERQPDFSVEDFVGEKSYVLSCPETPVHLEIVEPTMREAVYEKLDMSHLQFWESYAVSESVVYKDGVLFNMPAPTVKEGDPEAGVATKKIVWDFTHGDVGKIGQETKLVAKVTFTNKLGVYSAYPENITFYFDITFTLPEAEFLLEEKDIFWKNGVLQANVNRPLHIQDVEENCWFNTPIEFQPWMDYTAVATGLPCNEPAFLRIKSLVLNGTTVPYTMEEGVANHGVFLAEYNGEVSIALDRENSDVLAALNSEGGLQANVEWYAVAHSGDEYVLHTFTVNFIRPLNLNLPTNLNVKDAVTGGDIVTIQHNGLFTDWRGEAVFADTYKLVENTFFDWVKTCDGTHGYYVPEVVPVLKEAYYEVRWSEPFTIDGGYYEASATLYTSAAIIKWIEDYETNPDVVLVVKPYWGEEFVVVNQHEFRKYEMNPWYRTERISRPTGPWSEEVITAQGATRNEALYNLNAKFKELDARYADGGTIDGYYAEINGECIWIAKPIEIRLVVDIIYHPTEYGDPIPGYYEKLPCNEPAYGPDYYEGYVDGCWTWTKYSYLNEEIVPGQYWYFYGVRNDGILRLDLDNIRTNLKDGKLPAGASLVQSGNTVKYENVQSPIQYSYEIYIDAYADYTWGTLMETLTITANPTVE